MDVVMLFAFIGCCEIFVTVSGKSFRKLEFDTEAPSDVTYVRGKRITKLQCNDTEGVMGDDDTLTWVLNQKVNITFQECHSFHEDIKSTQNFVRCAKIWKKTRRYNCNVKRKNDTYFFFTKLASTLKNTVRRKGCFRVIAKVGNQTKISSGKYKSLDKCGAPTRFDAINPLTVCHRKHVHPCMKEEDFSQQCKVSAPYGVRVMLNLTVDARPDVTLQWRESDMAKIGGWVGDVYGYKIELFTKYDYHCNQLITKYIHKKENKQYKVKWLSDGSYQFSMRDNMGDIVFNDDYEYKLRLQALPTSGIVEKTFKINFTELCMDYTKKHGYTLTKCSMVSDIRVKCTPHKSVVLTWNNTHSHVSAIIIHYNYLKIPDLPPNSTSHTFTDVPSGSVLHMRLKIGKVSTYYSQKIDLRCKDAVMSSTGGAVHSDHMYSVVIILSALGLASLIIIAVVAYIKKHFSKPTSHLPFVTSPSVTTSETETKVMLLYRSGCGEVEELIITMSNMLTAIGIKVLSEIFQEERKAVEGTSKMLINDFLAADYVVILFVESAGETDIAGCTNYDFVVDQLLLPQLPTDNKRFIGVTLSRLYSLVPPYLVDRSYELCSELEYFLQHVRHGIHTKGSSRHRQAVRDKIVNIDSVKREIANKAKKIRAETHRNCYADNCCKGKKDIAWQCSSTESLTADGEKEEDVHEFASFNSVQGDEANTDLNNIEGYEANTDITTVIVHSEDDLQGFNSKERLLTCHSLLQC